MLHINMAIVVQKQPSIRWFSVHPVGQKGLQKTNGYWAASALHGNDPCEIAKNFRVLRKCSNKFDCLIFEMFFIRDLKPKLNRVIA